MNGLELSREYYNNIARPRLMRDFPELYPRLAAGLAGNGSECFGFDDELSRDHDWGIDFFIWTSNSDKSYISALTEWKTRLFRDCPPKYVRVRSQYGARIDVMTCGEFYSSLIGVPGCPETISEWLRAPEENYALAVNGEVFYDGADEFSAIRRNLLKYYPEDILLKKLSACCMALSQTGQYNHERVSKRGDTVTLQTVLSQFTENAIAAVFLLNRVFRPYYKWAFRAMTELPILGDGAGRILRQLAEACGFDETPLAKQREYIGKFCSLLVEELHNMQITRSDDWFLAAHGEEIRCGIKDEFLRSLPAQYKLR